jgi:hypothetical protein
LINYELASQGKKNEVGARLLSIETPSNGDLVDPDQLRRVLSLGAAKVVDISGSSDPLPWQGPYVVSAMRPDQTLVLNGRSLRTEDAETLASGKGRVLVGSSAYALLIKEDPRLLEKWEHFSPDPGSDISDLIDAVNAIEAVRRDHPLGKRILEQLKDRGAFSNMQMSTDNGATHWSLVEGK